MRLWQRIRWHFWDKPTLKEAVRFYSAINEQYKQPPELVIASGGPGFYDAIERKYGKRVSELSRNEMNEVRHLQGWPPL